MAITGTNRARSEAAFAAARQRIPGGVNSPVRAFRAVGGTPVFVDHASGARFTDVDGAKYIDYVMSWGPLILGHAHPAIVEAVKLAAERGTTYGAPTEAETTLASLVMDRLPSIERVRFVSSGTEATMSALRLARAATGRDIVIKCSGCYHGHADAFLISAGSGALTNGTPSSPGIPHAIAEMTLVAPYNNLAAITEMFDAHEGRIAAVIIEPYAGNMGLVKPKPGYLEGLRELTKRRGAVLIFDEVMTGFRVDRGGVQTLLNIKPDLTTLGKVIGGGLPIGAFGGTSAIMDQLSPEGPVYQAGTLSGNPLATAAGIATLHILDQPGVYARLAAAGSRFIDGLAAMCRRRSVPIQTEVAGSMVGFFFASDPVTDLASALLSDTDFYGRFFHAALDRGVYLAPAQFEAGFLSLAHDDAVVDASIVALEDALAAVRR